MSKNTKEFRNMGDTNKGLDTRINGQAEIFNSLYNPGSSFSEVPTRNNFQTYPIDHFCGTNAKVFFGDIWVDDVVTIQYNVKQDKEPIYGYASQNFDAIARGTIIVQGSFTIAFKEMGYLNVIQNALESQFHRASKGNITNILENRRQEADSGYLAFDPRLERINEPNGMVFSPNGQPEIIRQQQTIEDILMYKKNGNIISSGLSRDILGDSKERDFEDFTEILEDAIWGDANGKPFTDKSRPKFRRADEFDYNWDHNTDIGGIKVAGKTKFGDDYSQVLNVMISFGDLNDYRAEHTMTVLNDVHIVNTAMVVSPTGEPIGETYFFIARDINKTLSSQTITSLSPLKFNIGTGEDFKSTSEQQVEEIENFINKQDTNVFELIVTSISKYRIDEIGGKWFSDNQYQDIFTTSTVNAWDSKVDQIIKIVERNINDPMGVFNSITAASRRSDYQQWIMSVQIVGTETVRSPGNKAGFGPSGKTETFNIVLDQTIANTLTYKVISPTRNNYGSIATFTRADMWGDYKAAPNTGEEPLPANAEAVAKSTYTNGVPEVPKESINAPTEDEITKMKEKTKQQEATTELNKEYVSTDIGIPSDYATFYADSKEDNKVELSPNFVELNSINKENNKIIEQTQIDNTNYNPNEDKSVLNKITDYVTAPIKKEINKVLTSAFEQNIKEIQTKLTSQETIDKNTKKFQKDLLDIGNKVATNLVPNATTIQTFLTTHGRDVDKVLKDYPLVNKDFFIYNLYQESSLNSSTKDSITGAIGLAQFTSGGLQTIAKNNPKFIEKTLNTKLTKNKKGETQLSSQQINILKNQLRENTRLSLEYSAELITENIYAYPGNTNSPNGVKYIPNWPQQRSVYVGGDYIPNKKMPNYKEVLREANEAEIAEKYYWDKRK